MVLHGKFSFVGVFLAVGNKLYFTIGGTVEYLQL